jgi:hypothetical protein
MKIIKKDNFGRDYISDYLVAENVGSYYGEEIVKFLNARFGGDESPDFFELVESDYELYVYIP